MDTLSGQISCVSFVVSAILLYLSYKLSEPKGGWLNEEHQDEPRVGIVWCRISWNLFNAVSLLFVASILIYLNLLPANWAIFTACELFFVCKVVSFVVVLLDDSATSIKPGIVYALLGSVSFVAGICSIFYF